MEANIINVSSPTFFVKRDDPEKVSYESQELKEWKFVQTAWYAYNSKLKKNDFLYIYAKENNSTGFRGALLTPEHLKT
jgi:hypothetical protein